MRPPSLLRAVSPGWLLLLGTLTLGPSRASCQEGITAFVGVNVLPMDRERILENHTVVVQNGLIQEVVPSYRVTIPEGARVIPGEGMYLLPGLADMNVLLPTAPSTTEELQDFLFLYLANNATTIRGVEGRANHLQLKRDVSSGILLGPSIWVGAPPMGGGNAVEPDAAVSLMLSHRSAGYDYQPIRGDMSPEVWDELVAAAHAEGYTFGGTIPRQVGLRRALSSGISTVEHLDGYLSEVVSDEVRTALDRGVQVPLQAQLEAVEGRKLRAIAAHTRSSDTWVVPNLFLWKNRYGFPDIDALLALPEMQYVPSFVRDEWTLEAGSRPPEAPETTDLVIQVRGQILRALTMAGVGVLMGTGSPGAFTVPGFSLRHELRSMAAAGLTPYEILVTGTRNVAEYVRRELLEPGNFGTVEEGNRADLLLLRGNPFQDLEALWDQEGVMVRGRWISRSDLDAGLERVRNRFDD